MDAVSLDALLRGVADGSVPVSAAVERLSALPTSDLGYAQIDTHREVRTGWPEVIYCPGKTPEHIRGIAADMLARPGGPVLATRASAEDAAFCADLGGDYDAVGRVLTFRRAVEDAPIGHVAIVTAGTADIPVAQEAATVADAMGIKVTRVTDVGVAGLHRTLAAQETLRAADVVIVVAGMEGALPSVIGGLVASPVIAVPTSVGYGASFEGLSALLGMLTSCAPGIAVMNIDNGYGAAVHAARILRTRPA
jgi:pyridinium-3,5-biscarboxylic acid mononucleotide synthase